jgi:cell division protein FtsN
VFDVAIRRIQLDREQWEKLLVTVKRMVFFWKGVPRPAQADESLAALLTRRDQVRARQTSAPTETRPELFQPVQPAKSPEPPAEKASSAAPAAKTPETPPTTDAQKPESTTGRLLDAKRRARKKLE